MNKKPYIKELATLERLRKEIIANKSNRILAVIAVSLPMIAYFGFTLLGIYFDKFDNFGNYSVFIFILGLSAFLFGSYFWFKKFNDEAKKLDKQTFVHKYKDFYLKKYINSLGFNYSKYGVVNFTDIIMSDLFPTFQMHEGNDLITGKVDNVEFKFCDLILKRKIGESEQEKPLFDVVAFQGLVFTANFNKKTKGRILVMSKNITSKSGYKKIKMDNSEFNDTFNVFTTDLQNAMYVLTPALMDRILELKKIMKCPISLSFLYDRIFIKIDKGYDSFEPDLNKSIVSTNIARHIKIELDAMFNIVKILKLNNRIWTIKN